MFHRTASRLALGLFAAASAIALYSAPAARAEDINVGNYESGTNGFPWAVAMEEGFFKKYGLNITGIRNASGGQAIRQVIAGDLLFGGAAGDTFVYNLGDGVDVIGDYRRGDTILLQGIDDIFVGCSQLHHQMRDIGVPHHLGDDGSTNASRKSL